MTPAMGRVARPRPSFEQLCVIAHHSLDALGDEASVDAVIDAMKWTCARARLDYGVSGTLARAFDAVVVARKKGYRTPTRPGRSRRTGPAVWVAPSPFTRDELARAECWRRNVGWMSGCPHTPECGSWAQCRAALIRGWRRAQGGRR